MRSLILALCLAGCAPAADRSADEAEAPNGVPSASSQLRAAPPLISPIVVAEFESRLSPGAGCHVRRLDDLLLVAVAGDAVAKIDGAVVDLAGAGATYDALVETRRFTADDLVIEIAPDTEVGEGDSVAGLSTKPVIVSVSRGTVGAPPFAAAWVCGS